jgi:hypothetical protein
VTAAGAVERAAVEVPRAGEVAEAIEIVGVVNGLGGAGQARAAVRPEAGPSGAVRSATGPPVVGLPAVGLMIVLVVIGLAIGLVVVLPVVGLSAVAGVAAASEDSASGRARAAAQVTAIEEARCPHMPLILNIVILICLSGI